MGNGGDPLDLKLGINGNGAGASFNSPKSTPNPPNIGDIRNTEDRLRREKYERLISELQRRLKDEKSDKKKVKKEWMERLNKAKHDILTERKRRIAVEEHMEGAKRKSENMLKEFGEQQKQKEAELVNKLKKLEQNKKKYKDSASDIKKKMKSLKEEHEIRIHELENETIPTLHEQIEREKAKNSTLE